MTTARIIDHGFRRFTDRRGGVRAAVTAVAVHTFRRAVGLRLGIRIAAVPTVSIAISLLPVVGILAFAGRSADTGVVPEGLRLEQIGPALLGYVAVLVIMLAASGGADALCPDRRAGMVALYLSSPLSRSTYVASKALGVVGAVCIITVGAPLLLFAGYAGLGLGPDGPAGFALGIARVVGSGLVMAMVLGGLAMTVACATDRSGVAGAMTVLLAVGLQALASVPLDNDIASKVVTVLSPVDATLLLNRVIHGVRIGADVPIWSVVAGCAGWIAAAGAIVHERYRRMVVPR